MLFLEFWKWAIWADFACDVVFFIIIYDIQLQIACLVMNHCLVAAQKQLAYCVFRGHSFMHSFRLPHFKLMMVQNYTTFFREISSVKLCQNSLLVKKILLKD